MLAVPRVGRPKTKTILKPPPLFLSQGIRVNESLTILLPVRNAEQTLLGTVGAVIEIAAELTTRMEIAIVDDGSTDATEEVACELALLYPQVIVARHHRPRGIDEAIHTGMTATAGAIVIVQPQGEAVRPAELRRLWNVGLNFNAGEAAESETHAQQSNAMLRLMRWGRHLKQVQAESGAGLRMIRRERYEKRRPPRREQSNRIDRDTPPLRPRRRTSSAS